jgi:hypothetical protein
MWLRQSDGQMCNAALQGSLPGAFREKWGVGTLFRPNPSLPTARVINSLKPVQVVDLREDRSYLERDPLALASVHVAGIRSLVSVPMLKDGAIVGALNIYRQEVRPFTDKTSGPACQLCEPSSHRHRECAPAERVAPAHR